VSLIALGDASRTQRALARPGLAVSGWYAVAMMLISSLLPAQFQWTPIPNAPNTQWAARAYAANRDRVVSIDLNAIFEYDGTSWMQVASPQWGGGIWWLQYDRRGVVLVAAVPGSWPSQAFLYEWDGLALTQRVALPPQMATAGPWLLTTSSSAAAAGATYQLTAYSGVQGVSLTSWDGQAFTQMPTGTMVPPTIGPSGSTYHYMGLAYDETTQALVLFGRVHRNSQGQVLGIEGTTWEWSPISGWQYVGSAGSIPNQTRVWYDAHRGCLVRIQNVSGVTSLFRRTGPTTWAPVPWLGPSVTTWGIDGHDPIRNRTYSMTLTTQLGYIGDAYPSEFEWHGTHCTQNLSPGLYLTESWSRAWIGHTLSVNIVGLNGPLAGLGMGFDDQFSNGVPLPLSLASIGMPSCFLNIDPAATAWANVTGTTATMTLPIPFTQALVGVEYFQQPFAIDPGANALGIVLGNSIRGTVGRQQ